MINEIFYHDVNHYISCTSTWGWLCDSESSICEVFYIFLLIVLWSIRLHVPVYVKECMTDYLI